MAWPLMEFVERFRRHVADLAYKHSVLNLAGFPGGTSTFLRGDGSFAAVGGMTLISSQVMGSDTATITFSSIAGTFTHLILIIQARSTTAATFANILLQFNADAGANYDYQSVLGSAAVASAAEGLAQTTLLLGSCAAASVAAGVADGLRADIHNYAGAIFQKTVAVTGTVKQGTASGNLQVYSRAGWWRNTAAITQIVLSLSAGSFKTGSVATLYGLS